MREVLYFAHAVNCYNTPYEKAALTLIAHAFPGATIVNPNRPEHQQGYEEYKKRTAVNRDTHGGMNYFYDEVLPGCTGVVAMPFLDRRFGLGVVGETKQCLGCGKDAFGMFPAKYGITPTTLASWVANPQNGLFTIRTFTDDERAQILNHDKEKGSALVVGHQETRLRTYLVYNGEKRPYETAHLAQLGSDGQPPLGFYPPDKK